MKVGEIELTKYFEGIIVDEYGTLRLQRPKTVNDEFGRILTSCMRRDVASDDNIGKLMDIFDSLQVVFDDVKYPENVVLDVIFNILHRPNIPGEGVGSNINLGMKGCIENYIRGLDRQSKEIIRSKWSNSVNVTTGEWMCDVEKLERILRYVEEEKRYGTVIEFTSARRKMNGQELQEIFNQRAEMVNRHYEEDTDRVVGDLREYVYPIKKLNIDRDGNVVFSFDAEAHSFDAIAHGVIKDHKYLQMLTELNGGAKAKLDDDDDKRELEVCRRMLKEGQENPVMKRHSPVHVTKLTTEGGRVQWTETHIVTMEQFKGFMNTPEKSPNKVVHTW